MKKKVDLKLFKKRLLEDKLTKSDIAEEFKISRRTVVRIMKRNDLFREDAWTRDFSKEKLNNFQKEVLYGTLLGDSCLFKFKTAKYPSLLVYHAISQKCYVRFKLNIFSNFVYNRKIKTIKRDRGKRVSFNTCSHIEFERIYNNFYFSKNNKKKRVTDEILDKLTDISLAFWFMDDGSRCKNKGLALHTNSFTLEEVEMICKWFDNKYNISCWPQRRKENQFVVFFSNKTTLKFSEIVLPYILPQMRYKFKGVFTKNPQRLYAIPFILNKYLEDIV
ncbi:MAG: hypothetical protein ACOC5T_01830 [Elusimicrobiota bacterium]